MSFDDFNPEWLTDQETATNPPVPRWRVLSQPSFIDKDEFWIQADGVPIRYSEMGEQHLDRTVAMVRRNLKEIDDRIVSKAALLVDEVVQPESFWVEFNRLQKEQSSRVKSLSRLLSETRRRADAQSQENVERARLKWMRGEGENPELPETNMEDN